MLSLTFCSNLFIEFIINNSYLIITKKKKGIKFSAMLSIRLSKTLLIGNFFFCADFVILFKDKLDFHKRDILNTGTDFNFKMFELIFLRKIA